MAKLWTYRSSSTEASPTLYADGNPIADYTIKGNTVQDGTPTPSNPIDAQGVGTLDNSQYKIPISSGGVTTNIYLGSTQSTRKIKKLVLTGEEDWEEVAGIISNPPYFRLPIGANGSIIDEMIISSHYEQIFVASGNSNNGIGIANSSVANSAILKIRDTNIFTDTTTLKAYLATQYANGTPVIVYYVLATPETAALNEPLQKIGDYADTITGAQSQISIPTTAGENSITFLTDIQPSQFEVPIEGWYFDNPKKWDGSKWV